MATIKIKYVKSVIKRPKRQKQTLEALGFKKLNQTIEKEATPEIMGMVKKLEHLLKIVE